MKDFRDTDVTEELVGVAECGVGGLTVRGFNIINPNQNTIYVKFFDNFDFDITLGTTTPVLTIAVPSSGNVYQAFESHKAIQYFSTAIIIAATTGVADSDTNAPQSGVYVQLQYN